MTDIKLGDSHVTIEGTLNVDGPDIHLSTAERKQTTNSSRYRRAMVHGFQDQLILNYDNDYRGVEIKGRGSEGIKLNGDVSINSVNILDIINTLQEAVSKLLENQNLLQKKITTLERKVGIRSSVVLERFLENSKVKRILNLRIPRK